MIKVNIEAMKNYNWVKAMPELQREFFLELMATKRYPTAFAREIAQDMYYDVVINATCGEGA